MTDLAPTRPTVGALYQLANGDQARCMAICHSHVVVKWVSGGEPHAIYARADFAAKFTAVDLGCYEQADLFPETPAP
jgi:hypothetical protein